MIDKETIIRKIAALPDADLQKISEFLSSLEERPDRSKQKTDAPSSVIGICEGPRDLAEKHDSTKTAFRHRAGFGKRIEYWIIGRMLKEGLDVYVPLVDDDSIDAVVRREDGSFIIVQIKARSSDVVEGDAALFAAITHEIRDNYWFVFYSERMDTMWILSSEEFIEEAIRNNSGKNRGKRSIWFNGKKKEKETGMTVEYCKPQFEKYIAKDFQKLKSFDPSA